jgi:hypothetical protein
VAGEAARLGQAGGLGEASLAGFLRALATRQIVLVRLDMPSSEAVGGLPNRLGEVVGSGNASPLRGARAGVRQTSILTVTRLLGCEKTDAYHESSELGIPEGCFMDWLKKADVGADSITWMLVALGALPFLGLPAVAIDIHIHDSRTFREAKISAQRGGEWLTRASARPNASCTAWS